MKNLLAVFITLFLISSCGQQEKKYDLSGLKDQVMDHHDEVMPLMDPLYSTRRSLQKRINQDSTSMTAEQVSTIQNMIKEIEVAEDVMMDWMHNFNHTFDGGSDSLTYAYFLEKKASIEIVAKKMKEAKQKGQALLDQ